MKTFLAIVISSFFLTTSCNKEELNDTQIDGNGVIISLPFQWKKSLNLNGVSSIGNSIGYISDAIYYNGNIAIPTTNGENNRFLTLINSNNGETIWHWNDNYLPYSNQIIIFEKYQNNNLLTYQTGKKNYCINLDNGITQWRFQRNNSFKSRVFGLEEAYFTLGQSTTQYQQYSEQVAFKGNMQTGEIEEFIIPNFTINNIAPGNRIGDVTRIVPYKYNNVQYLAVLWQEPQNVNTINDWQTYLGLYNYETNQWIYEKSILNQPNINGVVLAPPKIYNDKIYVNVGKELFCHNLLTGNQIWSRPFPQDFLFSGFIIADNTIIANNEDTFTYGLNPENGAILWKTATSGTSGRMSYLNGIVYFVGGSSDKLHAIDIETGEHVWKLNSPDSAGFKTNAVYVFEATNANSARIIALTGLNAYSFVAYQ